MIVLPPGLARSFRAVARKCVAGRARGPSPPVVARTGGGRLTLAAAFDGVVLAVEAEVAGAADETVLVPLDLLDEVDADASVEIDGAAGTARWAGRGGPRTAAFAPVLPGKHHDLPPSPRSFGPVPPTFLAALHACGAVRKTGTDAARFALSRIQVRGEAGQVVATDGHQALIWGGFAFPFQADRLVPAVPVFGVKELAAQADVRVGATDAHLVVRAGPWAVWLAIDPHARFPDVAGAVPRTGGTIAGLDERDAAELLAALPGLPGGGADTDHAVTLDLDVGVVVRGRDDATGAVGDIRLSRSPTAGPPARVAVDRRALARAVSLGCVTLRVVPGKPLAAEGAGRTFVAVALDSGRVIPRATETALARTEPPKRSTAMRPHETNGHGPPPRPDPAGGGADPPDPLIEAEALRTALAEAATRAARLVQALKHFRRQRRVLETAWAGLQSLGLGPAGGAP